MNGQWPHHGHHRGCRACRPLSLSDSLIFHCVFFTALIIKSTSGLVLGGRISGEVLSCLISLS